MSKKIYILHIISSFKSGGLENFALRLAHNQLVLGHNVKILSFQDGPLRLHAEQLGIEYYILSNCFLLKKIATIFQYFSTNRFDIIHAHNPTVLHCAAIGKIISGSKLLMTDHAQTRGILRIPSVFEWFLTDYVVAVSRHTANNTSKIGYKKEVYVIHNGIETSYHDKCASNLNKKIGINDRPIIINVARLLPVKAQDTLIKAISFLRDKNIKVTLLIAGDGPEYEKLLSLCKKLNLDDNWVRLLGFRSDVSDLLSVSDIFALVSKKEGLPISILEAMLHGLPIIATPAGGVEELVHDGEHGIIVPFDDVSSLSDALAKLILDKSFRIKYGNNARKHVQNNFSFSVTSEKYLSIYYKILGQNI